MLPRKVGTLTGYMKKVKGSNRSAGWKITLINYMNGLYNYLAPRCNFFAYFDS